MIMFYLVINLSNDRQKNLMAITMACHVFLYVIFIILKGTTSVCLIIPVFIQYIKGELR
jgi:hypothetical protein